MSQVAISGNASGTGTLTIAAPNTNSNYTLTLPAATGTVASIASVNNNGVVYANSSGQPTTGTAFVFDGTNVGVGTSSPTGKLHIYNSTSNSPAILNINSVNGGGGTTGIYFRPYQSDTQAASNPAQATIYAIDNNFSADLTFNTKTAGAIGNALVERMRIDSSGNLLVGTTATALGNIGCQMFPTGYYQATCNAAPAMILKRGSNDGAIVDFYDSLGNRRGYINVTTSATTYNTISDYRLKENVTPMTNALAKVQALKPVTYTWKANGSSGQGFIAHELQSVIPDCVVGQKDATDADGNPDYQGIDTSFLVATLTAAIQEQQALIQQLQADVAALKGK